MILENEHLIMSPAEYESALNALGAREAEEINLVDFEFIQNLNNKQNEIMKTVEDEER